MQNSFEELNKKYNCKIQMGGSDQWGNIVNGIELVRKKTSNYCFGITSPLLTTSSGGKMGKSESGAIWLNEDLLSKGLAREIARRIQSKRKELDLDLEDTITLSVWLSDNSPKLNPKDWEYVKSETRASLAD